MSAEITRLVDGRRVRIILGLKVQPHDITDDMIREGLRKYDAAYTPQLYNDGKEMIRYPRTTEG